MSNSPPRRGGGERVRVHHVAPLQMCLDLEKVLLESLDLAASRDPDFP